MPQRTCPALVEIHSQNEDSCVFTCQRPRPHPQPHTAQDMATAFGEHPPKAVRVQIQWED
jgi:hypothetical protein